MYCIAEEETTMNVSPSYKYAWWTSEYWVGSIGYMADEVVDLLALFKFEEFVEKYYNFSFNLDRLRKLDPVFDAVQRHRRYKNIQNNFFTDWMLRLHNANKTVAAILEGDSSIESKINCVIDYGIKICDVDHRTLPEVWNEGVWRIKTLNLEMLNYHKIWNIFYYSGFLNRIKKNIVEYLLRYVEDIEWEENSKVLYVFYKEFYLQNNVYPYGFDVKVTDKKFNRVFLNEDDDEERRLNRMMFTISPIMYVDHLNFVAALKEYQTCLKRKNSFIEVCPDTKLLQQYYFNVTNNIKVSNEMKRNIQSMLKNEALTALKKRLEEMKQFLNPIAFKKVYDVWNDNYNGCLSYGMTIRKFLEVTNRPIAFYYEEIIMLLNSKLIFEHNIHNPKVIVEYIE
uniref:Uncharacterized protein n=1 Tax=Spodoptera frugiperda nuclear polyhedrosis virus TaxID=10455 RepID=A0A0R5RHM7_NPVSF|nr:hypothetical protein [Spodoptera frugiperda multiple nucleopolyhedrovirus]